MWSASDDYKSTKDLNEQAKAYERYKKAEQAYNADTVLVQDRKKEAEAIAQLDSKMKNAYGVMLDDVCAGLMAAFTLWLFVKFGVVVFK